MPPFILACSSRTISRNRRRNRFRMTAPPIRFEVMKPIRNGFSSLVGRTPRVSIRPRWVVPSERTRANSVGRANRIALGKVRRVEFREDVTLESYYTRTAEVFRREYHRKTSDLKCYYGVGLEVVVVVVSVFVSAALLGLIFRL